jgi:subtilisin family serine protease
VAALITCTAHAQQSSANLRGRLLAAPPEVEVFVQLETPSVAELNANELRSKGVIADSATQRAHAARLSTEQAQFRAQLQAYGAKELSTQRMAANGFRVRIAPSQLLNLRELHGVRSVGRVKIYKPDNIDSVPWIGATRFWATYGLTGENVKIGIIDSGIDYTHANFNGPGTPAVYAANDPNIIEPGTFPTAKVAGGYDFAGPTYNADDPDSQAQPDPDPLDYDGHGSHVAGTASGVGVPGSIGPGVAPGAKLYAIKVFGDAGGSTSVASLGIEWALDPNGDGDMSDHLDVINMSLGSPLGDPTDPTSISANNASALGIIVATSAGNEGDTPYVTGAPGVASDVISTAASTPGGRLYARFVVNAPEAIHGEYSSLEGAGPVTLAQVGPITDQLVAATPIIGCGLTNAAQLAGNIAFIRRGSPPAPQPVCGFIDKYLAAQQAGAIAIVVFNDGATDDRVEPIVMGGLDDRVTIAGLMISSTAGNSILAQLGQGVTVTATLDAIANPAFDDQIAEFSSRGPGHGGSTFKPDLSAPGVAIVSTGVGTGTGSANLQGTSMASPHTAGAAALLHQLHPKLPPSAIKALLQNSTVDANESGDTDIARQGVGVLRVDVAAKLTSYAAPAGVSFGRINLPYPTVQTESVEVHNLADESRSYSVQHIAGQTFPGVSVNCPSHVNVRGGGQRKFDIRLRFDPTAAAAQGVFDNASISQTEVDGWCVLSDGKDTLRVAYIAVVDPASRIQAYATRGGGAMRVFNVGPTVGIAEGFTHENSARLSREDRDKPFAVKNVGFRAANPDLYLGDPVLEFGIETQGGWEHISDLIFEFYLDTNNDGVEDVRLIAADLSLFQDVDPGQFVTAQFTIGGDGNLDWSVLGWDFNDRVAILPFTRVGGFLGRVPDAFSYRLVITGPDGTTDEHTGHVNMADEVTVDLNSFALDPFSDVAVNVISGKGSLLWLLPNDVPRRQVDIVNRVRAR